MEITEHIDALRSAGSRLSAAAADAGPGAAVPSCPGWVVRDLVRHQGGVHRWAASIVGTPRTEAWRVDLDEVVGTWPADADLIGWFAAGLDALVKALSSADPDLTCWTFLAAPSPPAMWARRQAHETSVHGVDAELAANQAVAPFPAPFAADGIAELLECFITRPGGRLRSDPARLLRVRCIDAPGDWLVTIGRDGVDTTPGDGSTRADCVLTGGADDLYLALWSRRSPAGLSMDGDGGVLHLFLDQVNVRWS
ncbi:MAG TPA: maleylpyruvate isomerase family mycothiol-dependent enzyme [Streptosporangiaceae bacterium]